MTKPGPKPMVKPKWHPADDLTEMQRRFVDYLAYNQGRTTLHKAALKAGYSENRARIEGSELMDNPKVKKYYIYKVNEINRSHTVTNSNYVLRLQKLSNSLEEKGKEKDCAQFENMIGKATGQFSETRYNVNMNAKGTIEERQNRIKRIKDIQQESLENQRLLKESRESKD
jgi:phage terminase small subunit|tara:strand:+ start:496 stop:1008 length:513 start_codon:yes stop_codon:yes gene_type:complete